MDRFRVEARLKRTAVLLLLFFHMIKIIFTRRYLNFKCDSLYHLLHDILSHNYCLLYNLKWCVYYFLYYRMSKYIIRMLKIVCSRTISVYCSSKES